MAIDKSEMNTVKGDRLVDAVRRMKINDAERNDVVVDMKEADRARLELLAERLEDVFESVPIDDDRFDFALSSGTQPRLWIDATSHVMMGRDRRIFRFVRDTRLGRVVLCESPDMHKIADQVTDYIAERMLERERVLAGETISLRPDHHKEPQVGSKDADSSVSNGLPVQKFAQSDANAVTSVAHNRANQATVTRAEPTLKRALSSLFWVLVGLGIGGGALVYATGILN